MIDINVPASLEYDTANAHLLADAIKSMRSLAEVAGWNAKATVEVEVMRSILGTIDEKQQNLTKVLSQEQEEHAAKPYLNKLLSGRKTQNQWRDEQARLERETGHIKNLIDQFESAIDFMPETMDDLGKLVVDCKQQKKELLAEKKAVNSRIGLVKAEARQQTANTSYGNFGRGDRRRIRLDKQAALRPHEDQKSALERQIRQLSRTIAWLEKIKE